MWSPEGDRLSYALFTGRGGIYTVRRANGVWQKPVERLGWGVLRHLVARRPHPGLRQLAHARRPLDHAGRLGRTPAPGRHHRASSLLGDLTRWSDDGRFIYTRNTSATGTTFWRIPLGG